MHSIIVIQTTLSLLAIMYLLYRCRYLSDMIKQNKPVMYKIQKVEDVTEKGENPFDTMSEDILLAFLEYKRSRINR